MTIFFIILAIIIILAIVILAKRKKMIEELPEDNDFIEPEFEENVEEKEIQ